ncbi:MAG: capsular polysaccharide synthesis protein [Roseiarcus sp.]
MTKNSQPFRGEPSGRPGAPTAPDPDSRDQDFAIGSTDRPPLPKVIWTLWLQGWGRAPAIVKACVQTWRKHNPGWEIRALNSEEVFHVLDGDRLLSLVADKDLPPEALSDCVRVALLARYGGVWVDSTCYCLRPLDEWLYERLPNGFFAFARPGGERLLSSWFLAAAANNHIIERWRELALKYWNHRSVRDDYFWFHHLFAAGYGEGSQFRAIWDAVPAISADGPHHYLPYETRLLAPVSSDDRLLVDNASAPLLKLTHKLENTEHPAHSVVQYLIERADR